MAKNKRPAIVWALGLLGMFGSAMSVLLGLILILDGNRTQDFQSLELTDTSLIWVGVITAAVGLFGLYLASSILSGQKWARVWYTIVGAVNIVAGFWHIIHSSGDERFSSITMVVLWVITLQLLYNDKADKYFED